ncbi:hypothetical protein PTSG_09132 [Salpingoeca rosetta]|uniref:Heterokaryon incompatibility domain-containing protein n=1 Tax=Salpingoeca rosetta (strain ATCC 50818 / BSB-021) TaxID=946362 RepID=F2UMT8_SALR5|nr:uncharacterized protein PTSG_09132 [Salpingoeca rosetta]EGD78437.1 hypothetical protein PTSG_09132 [Salpingoeca rosetta]|eukprot:XP_004989386.1 hypothetical protein PTSG_09132 [Salpingoeca rosetta]
MDQLLLPMIEDDGGAEEVLSELWTIRGPPLYRGYPGSAAALKQEARDVLANSTFRKKCRQIGVGATTHRLRIVRQSGLPPMRVLPAAWLKARNGACRIPRSHEGLTVDAEQAVCIASISKCRPVIVMVSHHHFGPHSDKPDDEDNSNAKALFEFTKWLEWRIRIKGVTGVPKSKHPLIFLWIDWPCIDQGPDIPETEESMPQLMEARAPYIESLSVYTACCHLTACIEGVDTDDHDSDPWCLVQRIAAYVYIPNGQMPFIVQTGFVHQQQIPAKGRRSLIDPLEHLDNASAHDAPYIQHLTQALMRSATIVTRPETNSDNLCAECLRAHPTPLAWALCMTLCLGGICDVGVANVCQSCCSPCARFQSLQAGNAFPVLELRADTVMMQEPMGDDGDEDDLVVINLAGSRFGSRHHHTGEADA